jgi:hypothetical protein
MAEISDHAVIRFLERVYGVDIDAVRRQMQSPALDAAVRIGCRTVKRGDGTRLKLRGHVVTTVLSPGMLPFTPEGVERGL